MSVDGAALRDLLKRAFLPTLPAASRLTEVDVRPFDGRGWYAAYRVDVQTDDGSRHSLFLKDFGTPRGGKGDMAGRRERERCVYAHLLDPGQDGTARCYGTRWDPEAGAFWLLLEYVDGTSVRQLDLRVWLRASAWLARFQAAFRARSVRPPVCPLVRHDLHYFREVADGAIEAISGWSAGEGVRVRRLVNGYDRRLAQLLEQPDTLVHGAFLPVQILAVGPGEERLCPLDWELAGLGPQVYDLGFLAYGFRGDERRSLLSAYSEEAARLGLAVPEDLSRRVASIEVHRTLTALGQSKDRDYDDQAILEYIDILERLMAGVEAGEGA